MSRSGVCFGMLPTSTDFSVALRFFRRRGGATAAIILTLALALAANTAAFAVLRAFLLSNLGVPQADRLHVISQVQNGGRFLNAWPNYTMLRDQVRTFDATAAVVTADFNWGDGEEARRLAGARVTAGFFRTMRVAPMLGRELTEQEQGPNPAAVVIISHQLWTSAFAGSPDVLSKTMRLNGVSHAIIGVMPQGFALPPDTEILLPFDLPQKALWTQILGARRVLVFGRLADGVDSPAAQQELKAIGQRLESANIANKDWIVSSLPVRDFYLSGVDRTILLVQIGAFVLLVLAATNLSSLLLAWAVERERESAVRLALGARPGDLLRQQAVQSTLLLLVGGVLGLGLALASLPALRELNPTPRLAFFLEHLHIDPVAAGVNLTAAAVIGLLVALVPLWQARRTDIVTALKAESRGGTATRGALLWQKAMVVTQSAITMVVLSAATLAVVGFRKATQAGPGYAVDGRGVFRVQLPDAAFGDNAKRAAFVRAFAENLALEPELVSAGISNTLPFGDVPTGILLTAELANGEFTKEPEMLGHRRISPDYLAALGVPLIEGRMIMASDTATSPPVAVISKALADKYWPGTSPLGKRFRSLAVGQTSPDITVVGVVGTVRDSGNVPAAHKGETLYVPYAQAPWPKFSVVVHGRSSVEAAVAAGIKALRATAPGLAAYDITTLGKLAWQANATPRLQMVLLTTFAVVAAGVAVLGSYGVMSQLVNNRSREMAVRLAIGDSPAGVLRRVLGQNACLATLGTALGALGAWFWGRWLQGVVTGVDTSAPGYYLAMAVLTVLLTQLATLLPARRAAGLDVQKTLMGG